MKTIEQRTSPLRGEVTVPGDKSISHRAVMFGSIARGNTEISGFLPGADCLSTVDCFRRLGVEIDTDVQRGRVTVHGKGMRGLCPASDPVDLYTGNSGTTTRIMSGILAPQHFTSVVSGDASISARPMRRVILPLSLMGASITSINGNDCAPLRIEGRGLHGITYQSPVASAQVKSSILCAGLYAEGITEVIEPSLSRDHTERMLRSFGADIESFEGKDACEIIKGKWVCEVAELTAFNRSEISTIKQFLSKVDDRFRPAYARKANTFPRRCVFFGTSNDTEFLRDTTGNRRFLKLLPRNDGTLLPGRRFRIVGMARDDAGSRPQNPGFLLFRINFD